MPPTEQPGHSAQELRAGWKRQIPRRSNPQRALGEFSQRCCTTWQRDAQVIFQAEGRQSPAPCAQQPKGEHKEHANGAVRWRGIYPDRQTSLAAGGILCAAFGGNKLRLPKGRGNTTEHQRNVPPHSNTLRRAPARLRRGRPAARWSRSPAPTRCARPLPRSASRSSARESRSSAPS